MFGAPIGLMARGQQDNQDLMTGINAAEGLSKLSMAPAQLAGVQAQTRWHNAEAGVKEQDLRNQQDMAASMSQLGAGMDSLEMAKQMGTLQLQKGMIKEGTATLSAVESIYSRKATEAYRQSQQERQSFLTIRDKAQRAQTLVSSFISNPTAQTLQSVKMQGTSEGLDMSMLPDGVEEALPVAQRMSDMTMTAYQRAQLKISEGDKASAAENRRSAEGLRAARMPLIQAQTEAALALAANRTKAGTAGASEKEQTDARNFIKGQLPDLEVAGPAAFDLANEAKRKLRQNPALSWSEAIAQSFDPKDFPMSDGTPGLGWTGLGKKRTYNAVGKTPERAIQAVPAPATRMEGRYYTTPKGVYQWTKQGWKASSRSEVMAPPAAAPAPEEE